MTFTSYSQNFEDVMLWRALHDVENGYYIDIGAQDPLVDSVSMAFYEHGWRGIHVEPTTQYAEKLRAARPDEIVMQVAIGNGNDSLTFFEFKDTGLSTADPAIAQNHIEHGFTCVETRVPMISLDALLDKCACRPLHWLKLDVEGLEKSVLESWKNSGKRPWILVIESTLPLTQEPNYSDWEHLVCAKGYEFVYFDGLNRFYISQEQSQLKSSFDRPPNIFDGFVLSGLASQPFYARAEANMKLAEIQAKQAENRALLAEGHAHQALVIAEEMMAFTSQFKKRHQDQIQDVLKVVENVETRTIRIDEEYQDRAEKVLKLAAEAQARVTEFQLQQSNRTEHALKIAEEARNHAARLEKQYQHEMRRAMRIAQEAFVHANEAKAHSTQVTSKLHAVLRSRSWRITAPLRWFGQQALQLREDGFSSRFKAASKKASKPIFLASIKFVDASPHVRRTLVNLTHKFGVHNTLRSLYFRLLHPGSATTEPVWRKDAPGQSLMQMEGADVSERTRHVYSKLKVLVAAQNPHGDH